MNNSIWGVPGGIDNGQKQISTEKHGEHTRTTGGGSSDRDSASSSAGAIGKR